MTTAREKARLGLFYLEEAVLDVLMEESGPKGPKALKNYEIANRAGMHHERGYVREETRKKSQEIVWGILNRLIRQNRVCKPDPEKPEFAIEMYEFDLRGGKITDSKSSSTKKVKDNKGHEESERLDN